MRPPSAPGLAPWAALWEGGGAWSNAFGASGATLSWEHCLTEHSENGVAGSGRAERISLWKRSATTDRKPVDQPFRL